MEEFSTHFKYHFANSVMFNILRVKYIYIENFKYNMSFFRVSIRDSRRKFVKTK